MSRPFNLPFLPRTDSAMTQMPVLRVRVVTEHPENLTKETANALAQRELSRHMPKILNYYQAQQANSRASGLDLSKTHMVNDNIELRHTNLNGTPILEVIVKVDDALSQLCIMVLHDGNKVSALKYAGGKFSRVYAATCQNSNWGAGIISTAQLPGAKNETIVVANASFTGNTIEKFDDADPFTTVFEVTATSKTDAFLNAIQTRMYGYSTSFQRYWDVCVTGDGSKLYTPTGEFYASKGRVFGDPLAASVGDDREVAVIDGNGVRYRWAINDVVGYVQGAINTAETDAYNQAKAALPYTDSVSGVSLTTQPVVTLATHSYGDYPTIIRGTNSLDIPYVIGDAHQIGATSASAVCTVTVWDRSAAHARDSSTVDFLGAQYTADLETFYDTVSTDTRDLYGIELLSWPPGANSQPFFMRYTRHLSGSFGGSVNTNTETFQIDAVTPYGVFPAVTYTEAFDGVTSTFTMVSDGVFQPWLHIANGTHFIQGFLTNGSVHLHMDGGANVASDIAAAIKTDATNIQTLLWDVPLKRIKQFR